MYGVERECSDKWDARGQAHGHFNQPVAAILPSGQQGDVINMGGDAGQLVAHNAGFRNIAQMIGHVVRVNYAVPSVDVPILGLLKKASVAVGHSGYGAA